MLILERRLSECVNVTDRAGKVIGRVVVLERGSNLLKLGFEGFTGLTIDREEVHEAKRVQGVRR